MKASVRLGAAIFSSTLAGATAAHAQAVDDPAPGFPLQFIVRSPDGREQSMLSLVVGPSSQLSRTSEFLFVRDFATFRDDGLYTLLMTRYDQNAYDMARTAHGVAPVNVPAPGAWVLMSMAAGCVVRRQRSSRARIGMEHA